MGEGAMVGSTGVGKQVGKQVMVVNVSVRHRRISVKIGQS